MTGFGAFARKEATEIVRTWRIWVLPGMVLFFALAGPPLAKYTPELVKTLAGTQIAMPSLPTPTYLDAYGQWSKNLLQIILFALIIIYAGVVSSERRSGTAALVLTKPVSRDAFVFAKATVHSCFVTVLILTGTLVTWACTALVFGSAPGTSLWSSAVADAVFSLLFIAIMILMSVLIGSTAGAAGVGIGIYAVLSIAGIWEPLARYSPAGLPSAASSLATGFDSAVFWPEFTAAVLAIVLICLAALAFRRQEL